MSSNRSVRGLFAVMGAVVLMVLCSSSAWAQAADPNPGKITVTGNVDLLNQYMFRGIRQNSTGVAVWPSGDLGLAVYSGEGSLKSAAINFGVWNSLHTGDTGQDSATGKLWYESDFYSTLSLGFGGGVGLGATYTAYTSPNNGFSTVKELMFKLSADDSAYMGKAALKPYAAVAFEMDTAAGSGQADGGAKAGKYLEVGIAPSYAGSKASLAVPVKVGMSLGDYYELAGVDNKFGYLSVAGLVTVPLGGTTSYGAWNLHFGAEFQKLGDTTKALNGGDDSQLIYSGGFGFTY